MICLINDLTKIYTNVFDNVHSFSTEQDKCEATVSFLAGRKGIKKGTKSYPFFRSLFSLFSFIFIERPMLRSAADRQSETSLSSNPVLPSQQCGPPKVPRPCRDFFFF